MEMQRNPRKRVIRTKLAMEIAGLNPLRFNEYVAAGTYPCAPRTDPGKPRRFREPDLIGLWWFSKMIAEGVSAARAGNVACRLVEYLKESVDTDGLCPHMRVTYVETTGFSFFMPTEKFAACLLDKDGKPWEAVEFQGGILVKGTTFELAWVRKLIAEARDPGHQDSILDLVGYAAILHEVTK